MPVQVWNGAAHNPPYYGWYVYVYGTLIGWYPPNTFVWPDVGLNGYGTYGPMAYGPATYMQVVVKSTTLGREVVTSILQRAWEAGEHRDLGLWLVSVTIRRTVDYGGRGLQRGVAGLLRGAVLRR